MTAHPLLECDDFDSLIANLRRKSGDSSNWRQEPFPSDDSERFVILQSIESDVHEFERLLIYLLQAISLERQVLENPLVLLQPEPNPPDFSPVVDSLNAAYFKYLTHEEAVLVLEGIAELWELFKRVKGFDAKFVFSWNQLYRWMRSPEALALLPSAPEQVQHSAKVTLALPENTQRALHNWTGRFVYRCNSLEELRTALTSVRKLFRAIDSIKVRFPTSSNKTTPKDDPSKPKPEGPFPPDGLRYKGVEFKVKRPKSWLLLRTLWAAENWTVACQDLAESVWRDREETVDSSKLGSVRRDLNKFFKSNDIPMAVMVANDYCSIQIM